MAYFYKIRQVVVTIIATGYVFKIALSKKLIEFRKSLEI